MLKYYVIEQSYKLRLTQNMKQRKGGKYVLL